MARQFAGLFVLGLHEIGRCPYEYAMTTNQDTSVLIVGGSVGGCAAAMAVASLGRRVILTEETDWVGGQLTSQTVPADEHPWAERCGCTGRYRAFRNGLRQFYREYYPLHESARREAHLNPGMSDVSRISCEPRVALHVIESMLLPYESAGTLDVRLSRRPIACDVDGDMVRSVTFLNLETGEEETVTADFILDATELGDLLPLTGTEYVSGAESQRDTDEPSALPGDADPEAVQAFTWCFPIAYDPMPGACHVIDKPREYDFWRNYVPEMTPAWTGPLLSWAATNPFTLGERKCVFLPEEMDAQPDHESLWLYRRIIARQHYRPSHDVHEATIINWPQNDYWLGNIIDKPADEVAHHLERSRQLSLSLAYWLQTEAPRPDGLAGYPGLYLRPDLTGTADGLAKAPYIREARRIKAMFTVTENHIGTGARGGTPFVPGHPRPQQPDNLSAEFFHDSVGIGSYRIDLHPDTAGHNYVDTDSLPFQIPLGSLIPQRMRNLLPACKNIGTTHITNGCYRLHPVEWNIGEAAGLLAVYCLRRNTEPANVRNTPRHLESFQALLIDQGIELEWPTNVPHAAHAANSHSPSLVTNVETALSAKSRNEAGQLS